MGMESTHNSPIHASMLQASCFFSLYLSQFTSRTDILSIPRTSTKLKLSMSTNKKFCIACRKTVCVNGRTVLDLGNCPVKEVYLEMKDNFQHHVSIVSQLACTRQPLIDIYQECIYIGSIIFKNDHVFLDIDIKLDSIL